MKKTSVSIKLMLVFLLLVSGCSFNKEPKKSQEQSSKKENSFTLNSSRIQVNQYATINYLDYVSGNTTAIKYNTIDTSKQGTYEVTYSLKDDSVANSNQETKTMIVDVVSIYENGIFNPTNLTPETITNPESITALVNKTHQIPSGWIPNDLVEVAGSNQQLRKEAAEAFEAFYQAAKNQGIACYIISGYRTNDTQALYWQRQIEISGEEYASLYSAYPGRSEHQLGLAVDISNQLTGNRLTEQVANSDIGKFIISDGYKYGFILRYPQDKVSITNYGYEPWHMRYVGKETAEKIYQSNLTLEEYIEINQKN